MNNGSWLSTKQRRSIHEPRLLAWDFMIFGWRRLDGLYMLNRIDERPIFARQIGSDIWIRV